MTQIFLGLILLAVSSSVVAFCFARFTSDGLDVELLSPESGAQHAPGPVVVRFRVVGGEDSPTWRLAYRGPDGDAEWREIASGRGEVIPRRIGTRNGVHTLQLTEPGAYEVRLTVREDSDSEEIVETVSFTVSE